MTPSYTRLALALALSATLAACGGGGGGGSDGAAPPAASPAPTQPPTPPPAPPPPGKPEAARFLVQSSFGPTDASIAEVQAQGYAGWIDAQMKLPVATQRPRLEALGRDVSSTDRVEAWWSNAMTQPDQLRQRVAFALSEILVVSDKDTLGSQQLALAHYYDLLASEAFGNYRTLLERVTLSPVMGEYLSMKGNEKAQPAKNIRPDENYARELMQLFSIGLVELNPDGTVKTGADGLGVPTYDQSIIEGYAQAYTGWTFANADRFRWPKTTDWFSPMKPWPDYHEPGAKTLLAGTVLPAGQTAEQDLQQALDSIFKHPNVGPFLAKQLIQRLVSSNPSPAYVGRVAAVFANNGQGVRGDLAAVIKALLLDEEARMGHTAAPQTFGKVKEPILRLAQFWRAFHAAKGNGRWDIATDWNLQQEPLRASSVFNFFSPFYSQPGALSQAGLVAPELQLTTESTITHMSNLMTGYSLWAYQGMANAKPEQMLINIEQEKALAGDVNALLDRLNLLLLGGGMSGALRTAVSEHITPIDPSKPEERVTEALALIASSPEFAVQK